MIKPDQLKTREAKSVEHRRQAKLLEERCDSAIRRANETGDWPARVKTIRTQIGQGAIADVIAMYTAAGWQVTAGPDRDCYMTIDRPIPRPVPSPFPER